MKIKTRLRDFLYESAGRYALLKGVGKRFMNLGYDGSHMDLIAGDENERLNFQLYNKVVADIDLKNKSVLEIGCGRGGGCYFLKEYKQAGNVTGIDLSESNIKLAKKLVGGEDINFIKQSADNINLPPNSFDSIVNIESSHCYADKKTFLKNVFTLLKPGGVFIYADTFLSKNIPATKTYLLSLGFEITREEDITKCVLESLRKRSSNGVSFFKKNIAPLFLPSFYGYAESNIYKEMLSGEKKYFTLICLKQVNLKE